MSGGMRAKARAYKMPKRWTLIKDNQRVLKCYYQTAKGMKPCLTKFRVKLVEPGFYTRVCPQCGQTSWFKLEETEQVKDGLPALRFRWATQQEAEEAWEREEETIVDLGIARNQE